MSGHHGFSEKRKTRKILTIGFGKKNLKAEAIEKSLDKKLGKRRRKGFEPYDVPDLGTPWIVLSEKW